MSRKRKKVRAAVQGRRLLGKRTVKLLGEGRFVYRRRLYDIMLFPPGAEIDLDHTEVEALEEYEPISEPVERQLQQAKGRKTKPCYAATLISNLKDFPHEQVL